MRLSLSFLHKLVIWQIAYYLVPFSKLSVVFVRIYRYTAFLPLISSFSYNYNFISYRCHSYNTTPLITRIYVYRSVYKSKLTTIAVCISNKPYVFCIPILTTIYQRIRHVCIHAFYKRIYLLIIINIHSSSRYKSTVLYLYV